MPFACRNFLLKLDLLLKPQFQQISLTLMALDSSSRQALEIRSPLR